MTLSYLLIVRLEAKGKRLIADVRNENADTKSVFFGFGHLEPMEKYYAYQFTVHPQVHFKFMVHVDQAVAIFSAPNGVYRLSLAKLHTNGFMTFSMRIATDEQSGELQYSLLGNDARYQVTRKKKYYSPLIARHLKRLRKCE
jgi:hypothetical protein